MPVTSASYTFQQVRYMKIIEKSGYQALPWVRYITQSGGTVNVWLETLIQWAVFQNVLYNIHV